MYGVFGSYLCLLLLNKPIVYYNKFNFSSGDSRIEPLVKLGGLYAVNFVIKVEVNRIPLPPLRFVAGKGIAIAAAKGV